MKKNIPEKCCANCRFLIEYPRNNSYGGIDYLCIKINMFICGIYKDLDKSIFLMSDGKTPDKKNL